MANYALILASGTGSRTGQAVPKQFITVNDKPIIIYTLEKFQNCKEIDGIVVVCLKGWEDFLKTYIQQYGITKVVKVVTGENDRLYSIFNGIKFLQGIKAVNIVVEHDAIRPYIDEELILDSIATAQQHNISVSFTPVVDTTYISKDFQQTTEEFNRDILVRGHTPVSFKLEFASKLISQYEAQPIEKVGGCMATLALALGHSLYGSKGNSKNFKITTKEDLEIFKGLILLEESHKNNFI